MKPTCFELFSGWLKILARKEDNLVFHQHFCSEGNNFFKLQIKTLIVLDNPKPLKSLVCLITVLKRLYSSFGPKTCEIDC